MTGCAIPGPGPADVGDESGGMRPLRHSYTNRTLGDGVTVAKRYQGPGALARSRRERAVLSALQGRLPVPAVLNAHDQILTMAFVRGTSGRAGTGTVWAGWRARGRPGRAGGRRPPPRESW
jgi:hypothetical protein